MKIGYCPLCWNGKATGKGHSCQLTPQDPNEDFRGFDTAIPGADKTVKFTCLGCEALREQLAEKDAEIERLEVNENRDLTNCEALIEECSRRDDKLTAQSELLKLSLKSVNNLLAAQLGTPFDRELKTKIQAALGNGGAV